MVKHRTPDTGQLKCQEFLSHTYSQPRGGRYSLSCKAAWVALGLEETGVVGSNAYSAKRRR